MNAETQSLQESGPETSQKEAWQPSLFPSRASALIWTVAFLVCAAVLLTCVSNDFWPKPLFNTQGSTAGELCLKGHPIIVILKLPGHPVERLRVWAKATASAPLTITAEDAVKGRPVATETYTSSGWRDLPFPHSADNVQVL